jgi:putative PIN family toxin of toxin-antitoxin system
VPVAKLRAVLDTSVIVAGIVRPAGSSGQVLRAFREGRFAHLTSSAILDEMVNVLARAKVQRTAHLSLDEIADLRLAIEERAEMAPGEYQDLDMVPSDPKDNAVVAAALELHAQYVVTLDAGDLLRLKVFLVSGHRPVQIESPTGFLRLLKR